MTGTGTPRIQALSCEGVAKSYGSRVALRPLSFAVDEGEHLVVRGPSGCGKTTLLRILAGLIEPDSGRVVERGAVVSRPGRRTPPHQRSLGMLFQGLALWPHLTALEQIERVLAPASFGGRSRRRLAAERALEEAGISALSARLPRELSGGERQRVAWVRAVARDPRILLLDEPLTSLDPRLRDDLLLAVRRHGDREGRTVILVTHDPEVATRLGYRVLELAGS